MGITFYTSCCTRYFRTGDIGELSNSGHIKVIDRIKAFFKLQQGIYVAPAMCERVYVESLYVQQVFIYGNGNMSHVAAVVVPSKMLLDR